MTDHTKLRRKAEAATRREWVDEGWAEAHFGSRSEAEFVAAASPAAVLTILDEIDALKAAQEGMVLVPTDLNSILNMGWKYLDTARSVEPDREWIFSPHGFLTAIKSARAMIEAATKEKP